MNNYIINPWFFYLISVCNNLLNILIGVALILFIAAGYLLLTDEANSKSFNRCVIGFIISLLVITFVPTQDVLIRMQLAKFATYENLESFNKILNEKTNEIIDALSKN